MWNLHLCEEFVFNTCVECIRNLYLILQFVITLTLFGLRLQSISFTESNRKPTNSTFMLTDDSTCHFRGMQRNVCEIYIFVRKSYLTLVRECIKLYVWFYNFSSPLLFPDCDFIVYRSLNPIENQQTNIYAIVNSTYHFRGVQGNVCVKSTSLWGSRIWHLWGMYQNLCSISQFLITLPLFVWRLQSISFTESNRKPTN